MIKKQILYDAIILDVVFISIFGWLQYIFFADLRTLRLFGWDDHLYRLTSTFLDPAFAGFFIAVGALLLLNKLLKKYSHWHMGLFIFLVLSMSFTYSRASFVAFFAGLVYLFWAYRKRFLLFLFGLGFGLLLLLLPTPSSEGANLLRTFSIYAKVENSMEGVEIFTSRPIFGVGLNNVCAVRGWEMSNSCHGMDNLFVFVLATTGVVGFVIFLLFLRSIYKGTVAGIYGLGFRALFVALIFHALFTNTFFYNFVIGVFMLLAGISRGTKRELGREI